MHYTITTNSVRAALVCAMLATCMQAAAQTQHTITLDEAIALANDSSLTVLREQNNYLYSYWQYRTFKAERLPSVSMRLTPVTYNRFVTKRYDSEQDLDIYRQQQNYAADGGLHLSQNFDALGGAFYMDTELQYMRNLGDNPYTQFSSIPVRIGYSQSLLGFNAFKWDKKIEPQRFEKSRRQLVYAMQGVAEEVVQLFFAAALAQANYELAQESKASADSLYVIGQRRFKIASITKADLLILQLDVLNSGNSLEYARINRKRAMSALAKYLNMESGADIKVVLPEMPAYRKVDLQEALQRAKANSPALLAKRIAILESQRELKRTKVENSFNVQLNASVGFNQYAETFSGAFRRPLEQELVSVSLTIPLVDWGLRRGRLNKAKNNLDIATIDARQEEQSIEDDVTLALGNFDIPKSLAESSLQAYDIANITSSQIRARFIIGKANVNDVLLAHNRQQEAQTNYISALQLFWEYYYKIRKLTLYDFEHNLPLVDSYDFNLLTR